MVKKLVKKLVSKLSGGSSTSGKGNASRKKVAAKPARPKSPQQTRDPVTGARIHRRDDD